MATATSDSEVDEPSQRATVSPHESVNTDNEGELPEMGNTQTMGTKSKSVSKSPVKETYNLRSRGGIYIPREDCEGYLPATPSRHRTNAVGQKVDKSSKPKGLTRSSHSRDTSPDVEPGYKSNTIIDTHAESINSQDLDQNQPNTSTWTYTPYHNTQKPSSKTSTESRRDGNQLQDPENAQHLSGGSHRGRPSRARRPETADPEEQERRDTKGGRGQSPNVNGNPEASRILVESCFVPKVGRQHI